MTVDPAIWLGAVGTATGCIGMVTGIAAAIYTRRQAVAAEGPQCPDVETSSGRWDTDNPGWFRIKLVVRNRTPDRWEFESAQLTKPKRGIIISDAKRPTQGDSVYEPVAVPLNELDPTQFCDVTTVDRSAMPETSKLWDGRAGDTIYTTLYIKPPDHGAGRMVIGLTFRSMTAVSRVKKVVLKREYPPMTPSS